MNYFVEVTIENHTNEMIAVDWDKFLIIDGNTSQPIIFDDTVIAFKDVPKGKSQVAPKTKVYRKITARDNIEYPTPFYTKKYIKIRPRQIGFLVPIDYETGAKVTSVLLKYIFHKMNTPISKQIMERFYCALDAIVAMKRYEV